LRIAIPVLVKVAFQTALFLGNAIRVNTAKMNFISECPTSLVQELEEHTYFFRFASYHFLLKSCATFVRNIESEDRCSN